MQIRVVFIVFGLLVGWSDLAMSADFVQKYERGKIMLRRKFYFDAIKELNIAVSTARGRQHFGAHFYLAKAYYWLPDIQKAVKTLDAAKVLAKNSTQKSAHKRLLSQIRQLYGVLKFVPEVDPEEVGKLQVEIKPKGEFSHKHKKRYFRLFSKRLDQQGGILLNGRPIYVPKAEYSIRVKLPQCLKIGFTDGGKLMGEVTVGDSPSNVTVKEMKSCECPGGQKIFKDNNKQPYCACPAGTGWDKKKKQCMLAKQSNPWPLILAISGAGVVAVGVAVTAIVLLSDTGVAGIPMELPGGGLWTAPKK